MKCDELAHFMFESKKKLHLFTSGNPLKYERENSKSAFRVLLY